MSQISTKDQGPEKRPLTSTRSSKRKKLAQPRSTQCQFWLAQKRRFCAMQRQNGEQFCLEHLQGEKSAERVPCPLDPKHSVWARDLAVHMAKCPARPEEPDPWFCRNKNSWLDSEREARKSSQEEKVQDDEKLAIEETCEKGPNTTSELLDTSSSDLNSETDAELLSVISIVQRFGVDCLPVPRQIGSHAALPPCEGKEQQRHNTQHAALVSLLQCRGLLSSENFYVEFGCGKAELSRSVDICVVHEWKEAESTADEKREQSSGSPDNGKSPEFSQVETSQITGSEKSAEHEKNESISDVSDTKTAPKASYGFGLVDRGANRMKADTKLRASPLHPVVHRARIDIEHLDLACFLKETLPQSQLVAISKHLCGAATDLTLVALANSKIPFRGLVVAMCCRHACVYERLLPAARKFLEEHGVSKEQFPLLRRIATWAVSGVEQERAQLGKWARRMVDMARVHAVTELWGEEYMVELVEYAEEDTTLENQCLCVWRKS